MRPLRSRPADVARHVGGAAAALLFLLPLWFLVSGSLRPLGLPPPLGVELLPPEPGLEAYRRLPLLLPVATYLLDPDRAVVVGGDAAVAPGVLAALDD